MITIKVRVVYDDQKSFEFKVKYKRINFIESVLNELDNTVIKNHFNRNQRGMRNYTQIA